MKESRKLASMLLVRWGVLFLILIFAALAIVPAIASSQGSIDTSPNSHNEQNPPSNMTIIALPAALCLAFSRSGGIFMPSNRHSGSSTVESWNKGQIRCPTGCG